MISIRNQQSHYIGVATWLWSWRSVEAVASGREGALSGTVLLHTLLRIHIVRIVISEPHLRIGREF